MKTLKKIILLILVSLLIIWITIFYIIKTNNNYKKALIKEVQEHYEIKENIKQVNKYDNNYIIITKNKVIVLNSKYENIKEEQIDKLAKSIDNHILVYKNNNLVYENKILKENKVIYEYYDAYTYEYKDNITLE